MKNFTIEVCAFSLEGALKAQQAGADRIELCASAPEGGITPSPSLIKQAKEKLNIPVMVMIRPRGGDFCYSPLEFEMMKEDIAFCKQVGVSGVVFGVLNPEGTVNKEQTRELVLAGQGMDTCFHRAIDMAKDYKQAFIDIAECGVKRVLTSGGENNAADGLENISTISAISNGKGIQVMVGSGVGSQNAQQIHSATGVKQYHLSARGTMDSKMIYRNPKVSMGKTGDISEYSILTVDTKKIIALKEVLEKAIK